MAWAPPADGQSVDTSASSEAKLSPPPPASIPKNQWDVEAIEQESNGKLRTLRGNAWVENYRMLFQADFIEWNEDTGDVRASGNVHFQDFERHNELWCDRLEYNIDKETGKFYSIHGLTPSRGETRPGVLSSSNPLYFQGEWAERSGDVYTLHDGYITNCKMPRPWWRLIGPKFEIRPGDRAVARNARFSLRGIPIFYTPYFYHSLQERPRKSGFLMPNLGNSSQRGFLLGAGYFWAINRSHDATYRILDYTSRGLAHHLDLEGTPRKGTEYSAVLYGVQDRGAPDTAVAPERNNGVGIPAEKYSGVSLYAVGTSDLGGGWTAKADLNYISSFRFRQEWTQSYNEAIGSEIHSVGFVNKNWSSYTLDGVFSRLENFQSIEVENVDYATGTRTYTPNAVIIRKLPEAEFTGRDRRLSDKLPVWFSFESSTGMLYRSEPIFQGTTLVDKFQTARFMNRSHAVPRLTAALHLGDFHFSPSFALHETYYGEGKAPYLDRYRVTGTNIVRSARDFALDIALPSLSRIFNRKTFLGDRLKHVIEPRAIYRYVTGVGSNFNRFIRFDETDLLSDTNELLVSLTNRLYARRGSSVQEVLTWELVQKRYFDPTFGGAVVPGQRNVLASTAQLSAYAFVTERRSASPIMSSLRISPSGGLGMQWEADYDPRVNGIVNSTLSIDYRWKNYFASAGNNEVRADPELNTPAANQYRFRGGFGDANRQGLTAGIEAIYDYRKAVIQYTTTQVTYNTDCCGFSVQYHRYNIGVRDEGQFRVAFSIANIGSFGTLRKQDRMF